MQIYLLIVIPQITIYSWFPHAAAQDGGKRNYGSAGCQFVFSLLRIGVGLCFIKIAGVRSKQLRQQDVVLCLCKKRNQTHQAEHFDFISSSLVGGHSRTGQLVETHMVMNTGCFFFFCRCFLAEKFSKTMVQKALSPLK